MKIGFVIGNGMSRSEFELRKLFGLGTTYGCNAIHRDFSCSHVICTKRSHLVEAIEWNVNTKSYLWTTQKLSQAFLNPTIELLPQPYPSTSKNDNHNKWTSIAYATLLASQTNETVIFIGADFIGRSVYSESMNYPMEMFKDFSPHIEQIIKIISNNTNVQYVFINDSVNDRLNAFTNKPNVSIDNYSNLESMLLT